MEDLKPSLANLMGMAGTAERAGNGEEALSYYNRVLEADPTCSEAWIGKGRAAGWLSSIAKVRTTETTVAFGHAIASAPDSKKAAVAERAAAELTVLLTRLYGLARQHHTQFATLPSARETYASASSALVQAAGEGLTWSPANRPLLEQTVLMARETLDLGLNEPLRSMMIAALGAANSQLIAIDPEYRPPMLAAQTLAEREEAKATFDSLGYVVAFAVLIIALIVGAASRG